MLVVLDIGNTAIKFGVFDGERLAAVERIEGGAAGENLFPIGAVQSADEIVAVSSSPANARDLPARLGRPVRLLGDEVRLAARTTYARPAEIGLDRIAAAWGARALRGVRSVAVADAGTAITVDALDAHGRFVAIAIAAGLPASAAGLARTAPHLPPASFEGGMTLPARGTADSLRAGFVLGAAGLVERLLDEASRAAGGVDACVLTGGDARTLSPHVRTPHAVEPHAVLRGILELHRAVPA